MNGDGNSNEFWQQEEDEDWDEIIVAPSNTKQVPTIIIDDDEDGDSSDENDRGVNAVEIQREEQEYEDDEQQQAIDLIDIEVASVNEGIAKLSSLRSTLLKNRAQLVAARPVYSTSKSDLTHPHHDGATTTSKAKSIDYSKGNYEWSERMKVLLNQVFKLEAFRGCQEGIINATMSGRDVVAVLPTGGGKSLTYQLPALLRQGTTLVVTPLISLMQDQVYNLQKLGIRAETINGGTSAADAKLILNRLLEGKSKGKGKEKEKADLDEREVKLIYVTPEKLEKSKTFVSTLQKVYDAGRLSAIVIDEAHCASQLGHNFRTSYKALGIFRTLFPSTPIMAVTATAPPRVLSDVLKILRLSAVSTTGSSAASKGTVLFTAPLYRPNLHYSVIEKDTSAPNVIASMVEWIIGNHPRQTGVIYCLSQQDTVNVANGIYTESEGKIKTASYHAGIADLDKMNIHRQWREKKIHVVVATIAFGMGIDAPDVRFVLHHSLSASIDGYYQESGRAGRDGKDADCVVFYRAGDATRITGLVASHDDNKKVYEMLRYATDLTTCRKVIFARYFSSSYDSKTAFQVDGVEENCRHCDNCRRDPRSFKVVDATLHTYRALRILEEAKKLQANLTLLGATELCRGLGGSSVTVASHNSKVKTKQKIDIVTAAGSKVLLSKEDAESLVVHLLLHGYLKETYVQSSMNINVYLSPSSLAARFTRFRPTEFNPDTFSFPIMLTLSTEVVPKKPKSKKAAAEKKRSLDSNAVTDAREGEAEEWEEDWQDEEIEVRPLKKARGN